MGEDRNLQFLYQDTQYLQGYCFPGRRWERGEENNLATRKQQNVASNTTLTNVKVQDYDSKIGYSGGLECFDK